MGVIRKYNRCDIEDVTGLYSSPGVMEHLYDDIFLQRGITMASAVRQLICHPGIYILGDDPETMAVMYYPISSITYTLHIALHPSRRGKEAVKECLRTGGYMFEYTNCLNVLAFARDTNRPSKMIAVMSGMKRIGKTNGTYLKDGKLTDETIYQMTEKEYLEAI